LHLEFAFVKNNAKLESRIALFVQPIKCFVELVVDFEAVKARNCRWLAARAGTFEYDEKKEENLTTKLMLTKPGHAMSEWELPFTGVKCWNSPEKWLTKAWRNGFFKSPDIGQELLWEQNPSVEEWATKLIFAHKIRK
jgi:hypothetical protein